MYEYVIMGLLGIVTAWLVDKGQTIARKKYAEAREQERRQRAEQQRRYEQARQRAEQQRQEEERRQEQQRREEARRQRRATGAYGGEKGVDDLLTYLRDLQKNIWKPGEGLGNMLGEVLNRILIALESNQIIKASLQQATAQKITSKKDPRYGKYFNIKIILRFMLHSERIDDPSKKQIYDQIQSAFEEYFTSRDKDVQDLRDNISQILRSRGGQAAGERNAADDFEEFRRNL